MTSRSDQATVKPQRKGKVVHLIGQLIRGGAERQLYVVALATQARGWEQVVVTFNPGDAWEEPLRQAGVRVLTVPRSRIKPLRLLKLAAIVSREKPDVLQSWSHHINVYSTLLRRLPLPAVHAPRLILSLRRTPLEDQVSGQPLSHLPHAAIYEHADGIVSNSQLALDQLATQQQKLAPQWVVGNIVAAPGRANPGEQASTPRLVAAGALIPRKAYDVLLRALGQLAGQGKSFTLALAGEGEEQSALEQLARELRLSERVEFVGSIPDVPALIAKSHILVHPSLSEGLSNTVLEGMADGVAIVATSVGAVPEMIEHEKTGLLVPPNDADALANAIGRVLDDAPLRARLGQAALERVRERCNEESVAAQYEAVYQSLLSAKK